jgi:large subunit ribosomal protein L7/L12
MITIRKILVAVAMTATLALSPSAFAESATDAKVRAAGEGSLAKMEEAASLQSQGADKQQIADAVREVRQLQKEFRFEGTEILRQKANDKLRIARSQVEKGDAGVSATLQELVGMYKEMMKLYYAAH